jgi:hypothetical protein
LNQQSGLSLLATPLLELPPLELPPDPHPTIDKASVAAAATAKILLFLILHSLLFFEHQPICNCLRQGLMLHVKFSET